MLGGLACNGRLASLSSEKRLNPPSTIKMRVHKSSYLTTEEVGLSKALTKMTADREVSKAPCMAVVLKHFPKPVQQRTENRETAMTHVLKY